MISVALHLIYDIIIKAGGSYETACINAKTLLSFHEHNPNPSNKNPATNVHNAIEAILNDSI